MNFTDKRLFSLVTAGIVIVCDQLSKWWVVAKLMQPPRAIEVTPFFDLVMVWNKGVTFGMFSAASSWTRWGFTGLALAIVVALWLWLRKVEGRWPAASIGLVIGGALGNVIDRVRYGAVADFLDFHMYGYHWPAFNVADSAITVGVALLFIDALRGRKESLN